jgi:hypothetical protein
MTQKTAHVMLAIDSNGHVFVGDEVSYDANRRWQEEQINTLWGYDIDPSARFFVVKCLLPVPAELADFVDGDVTEVER